MPRVTQEYLDKKKENIVQAALSVCQKKTITSVTMQDIINESGLSQGGIYRFYSGIDEIFADMLDQIRREINLTDEIDKVFRLEKQGNELQVQQPTSESQQSIGELIDAVYDILAFFMKKYLLTYHKIGFEFNMLIMNYPERAKKIFGNVKNESIFNYLIKKVIARIEQEIDVETVQPVFPISDIITFISASYDGIQMEVIVSNCYGERIKDNYACDDDIDKMFAVLCKSTQYLLGIKSR